MSATLTPDSVAELVEAVRSTPRLLPVGGGTKPRLSAVDGVKLSTAGLRGLVEYDPSEFTFTALAGTPVRDIAAALSERGQYLPFDPMLLEAGATLGGTVASGVSGPGRFRFGGLRDFILGVRFVDGAGRLLRMGGKVVKNAAGFDLPKFFVGSLGRFGVLAEITFKVFPRPASALTLRLEAGDVASAVRILIQAGNTRWEPEAVDYPPGGGVVCLRVAGPASALKEMSREILARWPGRALEEEEARTLWSDLREFRWAHSGGSLIKAAITPLALAPLFEALLAVEDARIHASAGGNMAYLSLPPGAGTESLDGALAKLGASAMTLRGNAPLWLGARARPEITRAVKEALDPAGRFPALEG
jgi:glycolate oxidase FAD binding subunit